MSTTVGPVLAMGAITIANRSVFHDEPMNWKIPVATALAAVGFSLFERVSSDLAHIVAWTALLTVLLTRTDPNVPSPVESAVKWYEKG
jgi:hypothetical protein